MKIHAFVVAFLAAFAYSAPIDLAPWELGSAAPNLSPNGALVLHQSDRREAASLKARAPSKYISPGTMQRNTIPCSLRGASASNCKDEGQANKYNRGCSANTQCRGKAIKRWLMNRGTEFVKYLWVDVLGMRFDAVV
ncbi:protein RALF-like 33 [Teratosphaeria destructans]|uniref:Protein RALF-like 33 n=1 Tax=Teratosphaeria destructans TaxID=418781 RepID=A0A9W7ST11_9PEZI|nr:protein RALF-like 33 [Teratosphaeria destructans]